MVVIRPSCRRSANDRIRRSQAAPSLAATRRGDRDGARAARVGGGRLRPPEIAASAVLRRLAALTPSPYTHLVRYHGVFANRSAYRRRLPPAPVADDGGAADSSVPVPPRRWRGRVPWAQLLMRVFSVDALRCPRCATPMVVLALISDPPVVARILTHLGLPAEPPAIAQLREREDRDPGRRGVLRRRAVRGPRPAGGGGGGGQGRCPMDRRPVGCTRPRRRRAAVGGDFPGTPPPIEPGVLVRAAGELRMGVTRVRTAEPAHPPPQVRSSGPWDEPRPAAGGLKPRIRRPMRWS
jgi:hypothetical protein